VTEELIQAAFLGGFLGGAIAQALLGTWLLSVVIPKRIVPLERRVADLELVLRMGAK
jgi:hypothetical protein